MRFSFVLSTTLLAVFLLLLVAVVTSAEEEDRNHHHHHDHQHGSTKKHVKRQNDICSNNNSVPLEMCLRGSSSNCWWKKPFFCMLPDYTYECLSPEQARLPFFTQVCARCYDLRRCNKGGQEQCPDAFCEQAESQGKSCPQPENPIPENHWICEQGPMQYWCGINESCESNACLAKKLKCFSYCDFRTCQNRRSSCKDVQCSKATCEGQNGYCQIRAPYLCQATHNCAANPDYWPKEGCNSCCDVRTCLPFQCGKCTGLDYDRFCVPATTCSPSAPYVCTSGQSERGCESSPVAWPARRNTCNGCCICPSL